MCALFEILLDALEEGRKLRDETLGGRRRLHIQSAVSAQVLRAQFSYGILREDHRAPHRPQPTHVLADFLQLLGFDEVAQYEAQLCQVIRQNLPLRRRGIWNERPEQTPLVSGL